MFAYLHSVASSALLLYSTGSSFWRMAAQSVAFQVNAASFLVISCRGTRRPEIHGRKFPGCVAIFRNAYVSLIEVDAGRSAMATTLAGSREYFFAIIEASNEYYTLCS